MNDIDDTPNKLVEESDSFFSSQREKRLWGWVLVVIVGIFIAVVFGRVLLDVVQDSVLISNGFWLSLWLIGFAILMQGVKSRPGRHEVGVWLGIIAVYLLTALRMAIPEERSHLIEYSILALVIYEALAERKSQGRHVPYPALLAIGMSLGVGVIDETVQWFLPGRVFDWFDILFDGLASVMAVSGRVALQWARQRIKP